MNNQEFQNTCKTMREKFENGTIEDPDIDLFADIISNVLDRADLKKPDTEYDKLWQLMVERYCNNIGMTPLLARMYQICRMYTKFRRRTLTDIDDTAEKFEEQAARAAQYHANIVFHDNGEPIASCWYEDVDGIDGIVERLEFMLPSLETLPEDHASAEAVAAVVDACVAANAGVDVLDEAATLLLAEVGIDVPVLDDGFGVIALDKRGMNANRERGGASVKIDLAARTMRIDCYTVYSVDFYKLLSGDDKFDIAGKEELRDADIEFPFEQAREMFADWTERLDAQFAIPGSPSLVGTKRPVVF